MPLVYAPLVVFDRGIRSFLVRQFAVLVPSLFYSTFPLRALDFEHLSRNSLGVSEVLDYKYVQYCITGMEGLHD